MMTVVDKGTLMETVLEKYDIPYKQSYAGWQTIHCPNEYGHANGDLHPSARVNLTVGMFACQGCDMKGDAYNIIQTIENIDFKAAKEQLGGISVVEEPEFLF